MFQSLALSRLTGPGRLGLLMRLVCERITMSSGFRTDMLTPTARQLTRHARRTIARTVARATHDAP